jgi:uroporphyrinogen-III synthase
VLGWDNRACVETPFIPAQAGIQKKNLGPRFRGDERILCFAHVSNCQHSCDRVRLLVTRPQHDGERTAARLRARGHHVTLAPLLRVEAVDFEFPREPLGAVAITSANAARAIVRHPRRDALIALPVFAVGRHTAEAARAAGFREVECADGDKDDLTALLRARFNERSALLLYLAGEDRAGDLAASGVPLLTAVVYRAVKVERFAPDVAAALVQGALDGVLHFSRRSAQAYLDCAARARILERALAPVQFCLSRQVSQPLAAAGAAAIRLAPQPNEAAMIDLVGPA